MGRLLLTSVWWGGAAACAALLASAIYNYPPGGAWLALALLLAAAVCWRWRGAWLVLVPALLPLLDLSPWTGWLFISEFDCLLATVVLVHALLRRARPAAVGMGAPAAAVLVLLAVSTALSVAIGLAPFHFEGIDAGNPYLSQYNALRLAKGLFWPLMLLPLLRDALSANAVQAQRRLAFGMLLGVLAAGCAVLWERAAFPGVFNFRSGYRVVGMFSSMHVGGAMIEAWFALGLPFVVWWTVTARGARWRLLGALSFLLGVHAMVVTYARAGQAALLLGMAVLAASLLASSWERLRQHHGLRAAALLGVLLMAALPVLHGAAMQRRLASSGHDLAARAGLWKAALVMGAGQPWLGAGLGSYPRLYRASLPPAEQPASYQLAHSVDGRYLVLHGGSPMYVEQFVDLRPGETAMLSLRVRPLAGEPILGAAVCQKWMLYSAHCDWSSYVPQQGQWQTLQTKVRAPQRLGLPVARPLKFSLTVWGPGSELALDGISLRSERGRELLANGGFDEGMQRWFFTVDSYLPYHLENSWVQCLVEQGWLGLLLMLAWCAVCTLCLLRRFHGGDWFAPVLAASLAGTALLSAANSLADFPALVNIVFLIMLFAVLRDRNNNFKKTNIG